jgi:RHS repeat-associated protein
VVTPARFERATFPLGGGRSIQLSYGAKGVRIPDTAGRLKWRWRHDLGHLMIAIYGAYGESTGTGKQARSAYTGACIESGTGAYALGKRLYSPVLRRFLNPDPVSPFGTGGLNRYGYCSGDPVNRIDPSGKSWQAWLGAILGAPRAPVRNASANHGLVQTPDTSTTTDALMSPVVLASAVSAVTDSVAPLVKLGSIASKATHEPIAGGVFGWVSLGSGPTPGDMTSLDNIPMGGVSVTQRQDYRRTTHTYSGNDHRIDNYEGRAALLEQIPSRMRATRSDFTAEWQAIHNSNGGTNFVADSETSLAEVFPLMESIGRSADARQIILLAGAHGSPDGLNWGNGRRFHAERRFFELADTIKSLYASDARRRDDQVDVRNLGDMSNIDFVRVSNSNAIVVHIYCYGVADRELMFEHNISLATTYRL